MSTNDRTLTDLETRRAQQRGERDDWLDQAAEHFAEAHQQHVAALVTSTSISTDELDEVIAAWEDHGDGYVDGLTEASLDALIAAHGRRAA